LIDSGANVFQPTSFEMAQKYLDDWSRELSELKQSIDNFVPMVNTQKVVSGVRAFSNIARGEGLTSELLNSEAIEEDILPQLRATSAFINDVEARLTEARRGLVNERIDVKYRSAPQVPTYRPAPQPGSSRPASQVPCDCSHPCPGAKSAC
jgi:hypothetical protein